jgi:hypothetical protein
MLGLVKYPKVYVTLDNVLDTLSADSVSKNKPPPHWIFIFSSYAIYANTSGFDIT